MVLLYTLLPILVILAMLLIFKKSADISGFIGFLVVSIVAFFAFKTGIEVIWRSALAGFIKSFSVSLIVATSLLQMAFLEKTGALKRIIVFIKTIASENKAVQIMLINIGFGTLMVSVGATPVSLLPPILLAMGYSTSVAIMLPAIGYDSLCTYALLGAPIVVFVDVANKFFADNQILTHITLSDAGKIFFMFLPIVSTLIGFCMLYVVDKWNGVKKGFIPCIITGLSIAIVSYLSNTVDNLVPLTGVLCGFAVILVMGLYLKASGNKLIDRSRLSQEDLKIEKSMPLWKALSPWALLIIIIVALNVPPSMFDLLYKKLLCNIYGIAADGKPIATRAIWNAYTWIFVSTILSIPILMPSKKQIKETFSVWIKRAPRPIFAAAIFFSIGEIMNMSGYSIVAKKFVTPSMVKVLADSSAVFFKGVYGFAANFIGLFGGFITGSEASTIGMFGKYALATANSLKFGQTGLIIIAAALAFGGGLASVISPAKLQNAAASIDKMGEENKIIRLAFVFSIILTTITAIFTMVFLNFIK